jgi:metalloendopeptidase OMA1, mitochondrial
MRRQITLRLIRVAAVAALAGATAAPAALAQGSGEAKDVGRAMEKEYGVVGRGTPEGRRLYDELERVTTRITSAAGFNLKSATLLGGADAKHDNVINAFALPDGRIYVTLGLARAVQKAPDPDAELAFVVGHETTHVIKKHGEKQSRTAAGAGIAAVLLGAVTRNPGLGSIANAGAEAYVMHFSRRDEYEADRGGLTDMAKAGYPLDAAVSMLKRLETASGAQGTSTLNGWFGSHPLTGNRVRHIQALIAQMRGGIRG